ncbi:MAG TPA: cytochrome c oxidase assembly protein [Rhizomicrobium sp.]|nr:cytochrome c oxidase assembly protein [Rhizomicrobium sp.]
MPRLKPWPLTAATIILAITGALSLPGDMLFSIHMAQHLLLIVAAAPLLVLGGVRVPLSPLSGWGAFIAVFIFWHWPAAFGWAAVHHYGTLLEMGSILITALSFWNGVLGENRLNDGTRALMVMTAAILTDLPGVVMLFAPRAICVMPHENAARFGLTPLTDQQLAGLLMWVPANLVFFGIATFLFARWISGERRPMVTS